MSMKPIRSLEVQLAGANENLELDQKLKEKLRRLKTQKLQDLMTLNHTREGLIDCMRKGWAKTDLSRQEITSWESIQTELKQRNNWSTEAGEWQIARTTQETRVGYRSSHCMLQSAMEQHAFAVSIRTKVDWKMKEMDRALREEEAHIQWLEREGTYISIPDSLQQLYISFVRLHLDYAAPVWDFQLQKTWINLRRSKSLQHVCHRVLWRIEELVILKL